jgi:hypothetical protein
MGNEYYIVLKGSLTLLVPIDKNVDENKKSGLKSI